jgi:hypothetical protein
MAASAAGRGKIPARQTWATKHTSGAVNMHEKVYGVAVARDPGDGKACACS